MDELFNQLARIIETQEKIETEKAETLALKEIVLSGLSRNGFFKECPYLSNLDLYKNNCLYLSFLCQGADCSFGDFANGLKYELEAFGIDPGLNEDGDLITITKNNAKVIIFIYKKDLGLKSTFSYQQQPIPYELRTITAMTEGVRTEIEKARDGSFPAERTADKKKKSKAKPEQKKNKEQDTHWVQPSLFDF